MLEVVKLCEGIAAKELNWSYSELSRSGNHIWWISEVSKFKSYLYRLGLRVRRSGYPGADPRKDCRTFSRDRSPSALVQVSSSLSLFVPTSLLHT